MATNKRSIGGDGLEQGGANLGNSYESTNNTTPAGGSQVLPTHDAEPSDFDTSENKNQDTEEEGNEDE